MAPGKHLWLACGMATVLLIVGVLSYAAFPAKAPDQPVRLMFEGGSGKVLFDHKAHTADSGYALSCEQCHHHPAGDKSAYRACGDCHRVPEEGLHIPRACGDCHDPADLEGFEMKRAGEAFHKQCIGCHREAGAGPEACASCHKM